MKVAFEIDLTQMPEEFQRFFSTISFEIDLIMAPSKENDQIEIAVEKQDSCRMLTLLAPKGFQRTIFATKIEIEGFTILCDQNLKPHQLANFLLYSIENALIISL